MSTLTYAQKKEHERLVKSFLSSEAKANPAPALTGWAKHKQQHKKNKAKRNNQFNARLFRG